MNLNDYIKEHKISCSGLARLIDVDISNIFIWKMNNPKRIRMPSDENMKKLAKASNGLITYNEQWEYYMSIKKGVKKNISPLV